jgi:ornithine decarboxylase
MELPRSVSDFIAVHNPSTPVLVVSLDKATQNYHALVEAMPDAWHHYAIKANPHPDLLVRLNELGCRFECASVNEIDMCLAAGATPSRILYGNPLKKAEEIRQAFARGIEQYVFDAELELEKIARHAPGVKVVCRIKTDGSGAVSPLSVKFGCPPDKAAQWLLRAPEFGLVPHGISFHTGSQQLKPESWEAPIEAAAKVFETLARAGIDSMRVLNVGGGFPVAYRSDVPRIKAFGESINAYVAKHFGAVKPIVYTEPGRYMAGDAGFILSEVVLISPSYEVEGQRWVYLDIGRYGGLVEEKIDYPILSDRDGPTGPVVLAGQTCDSNDVIYRESFRYELPLSLMPGDRVVLAHTGAYTTTYSTNLNGFPLLTAYCT